MEILQTIEQPQTHHWRERFLAGAAGLAVVLGLGACSVKDLNPSNSVTHDASGGAVKEIEANYPGASHIKVTHANDNPNYMSWELPDGRTCTAFASATHNRGATPGRILSEPYCRTLPKDS